MAALGEELLNIVNRLQDLVFNTIGNDSLDLPQIVCRCFHADGGGKSWLSAARLTTPLLAVLTGASRW